MADVHQFNPGDIVQLRSGGPAMTVTFAGDSVGCKWWNVATAKFELDKFLPTSIQPSSPDPI